MGKGYKMGRELDIVILCFIGAALCAWLLIKFYNFPVYLIYIIVIMGFVLTFQFAVLLMLYPTKQKVAKS